MENPANEPQYNKPGFLELGVSPEQAPDTPTYVTIHFEQGVPTAVDGKEMGAVELVEALNKVGGANGIGLLDIVENRLVGMKSRGVYETPGGAILYKAINVLETITLDKESAHFKAQLAQKYAEIVYNGQWFTPLREALAVSYTHLDVYKRQEHHQRAARRPCSQFFQARLAQCYHKHIPMPPRHLRLYTCLLYTSRCV